MVLRDALTKNSAGQQHVVVDFNNNVAEVDYEADRLHLIAAGSEYNIPLSEDVTLSVAGWYVFKNPEYICVYLNVVKYVPLTAENLLLHRTVGDDYA